MHHHYKDIRDRIAEPPKWWDENAVPRYSDFSPDEVANIYSDEVALVLIACQACATRFQVAFSWGMWDRIQNRDETNLRQNILHNAIHYGDPPNTECCPAGATMNCDDLKVLEYWVRHGSDWTRDSSLEIMLDPDLR